VQEGEVKSPEKNGKDKKPPKTLLEWKIGDEKKGQEKEEKDGNQDKEEKDGDDQNNTRPQKNGDGKRQETDNEENEEEKPIDTDRPDFGAATTTVGRGRAVLETGYSYFHDDSRGSRFTGHSYPEALLRVGLFAEWFEFRIGQNFANFRTTPSSGLGLIGNAEPVEQNGAQDLYLGVKLALTEQKTYMPESVIIIQTTVPSGSRDLTAGQVLPGVIYLFSWDLIKDRLFLSGLIEADRVVDHSDHFYVQVAQTLNLKYAWTRRFRTFLEWVALYPESAIDPGVGPEQYIHPGMTYFVTDNIQLDAHLFIGLNEHAIDFFGGPGFSIRY
jgi:hypothetical protein